VTQDENLNGEISMSKKHWTKIYERTHPPRYVGYTELDLSSNSVVMRPGQVKGICEYGCQFYIAYAKISSSHHSLSVMEKDIHSTRRGDEAIVYDNKEKTKTHDDGFITVLPGRAHVSERVFGSVPIWGW
jgi:hypothetical protein